MEEQNWLNEELNNCTTQIETIHKLSLKLEENKIYDIEIDFSKPFEKWTDPIQTEKQKEEGRFTIKKIIPIKYNGQDMNFWLNTANPIYKEILEKGKLGITHFKIIRIGQAKATRYKLVE